MERFCGALLTAVLVWGGAGAAEGRSGTPEELRGERAYDSLRDPRLGGEKGKLRYRVARSPYERVQTPDVVVLKDGTELEAYFLEAYGDWFVFYVKETANSWLKEEIPRAYVEKVDFGQYLPRDPIEPPSIEPARKQPVPKEEVLAGVFEGSSGRATRWRISFRSEIDAHRDHAEDATEYGEVEVRSDSCQELGGTRYAHGTRAEGRYFLYAPGTVNNREWVLVLSDIVHSTIERSPEAGFFTERIADETFILRFDREEDAFRLEWSNLGNWSWVSLVGVRFERAAEASPKTPELPPRAAPRPDRRPAARGRERDLVARDSGWWGSPNTYWETGR
ncbi:MAG: hypothetical protein ACUVYA_05310 [Planctomycetota bacterium]